MIAFVTCQASGARPSPLLGALISPVHGKCLNWKAQRPYRSRETEWNRECLVKDRGQAGPKETRRHRGARTRTMGAKSAVSGRNALVGSLAVSQPLLSSLPRFAPNRQTSYSRSYSN